MDSQAKLEEIESEILKIFEDCKSQGMSREEIIQVFSPLGLDTLVKNSQKTAGNKKSVQHKKPDGKFKKFLKILLVIGCLGLIGCLIVTSNGERMKSIRFHTLAVIRIALIKVNNSFVMLNI